MISTVELTLSYGKRILFENVSVKFTPGNCYGLIGANGAGKSSFLKLLSGELTPTTGSVAIPRGLRLSVLRQDHHAFDKERVIDTVLMGNAPLYKVMKEKDALYAKPDFSDADGIKVSELEALFTEMNGWDAETNAATLLGSLGIVVAQHERLMSELSGGEKVRVLLAQALFGDPDILLMDEPTNHLDVKSILWLEEFLAEFKNTVIVVSHDRHFLNKVCTHIADIDFQKLQIYSGNYAFWYESSQLALSQSRDQNKKKADKIKELEEFVRRFSANASKSRQATARKKMLDNIKLDEIKPSSRKYPYIVFKSEKDTGKEILTVQNLTKSVGGEVLFKDVSFTLGKGERIAFMGDDVAVSTLLNILAGEDQADSGEIRWGQTVVKGYFPSDNAKYFKSSMNLVDWLRQYSENKEENFVRTFLGRMLFTGDESQKAASVLSGGEKVRCLIAKLMLLSPNVLILDQPTNHLDLESITALNDSLLTFEVPMLLSSHDVQFTQSLANRVIAVSPQGYVDRRVTYEEFLAERAS